MKDAMPDICFLDIKSRHCDTVAFQTDLIKKSVKINTYLIIKFCSWQNEDTQVKNIKYEHILSSHFSFRN